ncbi:ferredoxin [Nocardia sp. NPDC005978]|uniref:ferredoxin n=1 Tax=unclassified Nocardia TaxID=2637762 RepID=UPI0033B44CD0
MKVQVDSERCQGHTLCALSAPAAFELSEIDGHSSPVYDGDVPGDQEEPVREAARSCPERAITLI